jgi:hypothetical protein
MFRSPRFFLGQTMITRRARTTLTPEEVIAALGSHVLGDWGEVDQTLVRANEQALEGDGPLVSSFRSPAAGTRFFVWTTADRSMTTVFLPEDRGLSGHPTARTTFDAG